MFGIPVKWGVALLLVLLLLFLTGNLDAVLGWAGDRAVDILSDALNERKETCAECLKRCVDPASRL